MIFRKGGETAAQLTLVVLVRDRRRDLVALLLGDGLAGLPPHADVDAAVVGAELVPAVVSEAEQAVRVRRYAVIPDLLQRRGELGWGVPAGLPPVGVRAHARAEIRRPRRSSRCRELGPDGRIRVGQGLDSHGGGQQRSRGGREDR